MRHSLLKLLAVTLAVLILTSCAQTGGPDEQPSGGDAPEVADTAGDESGSTDVVRGNLTPVEETPDLLPTVGTTFSNDYYYDDDLEKLTNVMEANLLGVDPDTREAYPELAVALDRCRADTLEDFREIYQAQEEDLEYLDASSLPEPLSCTVRSFPRRADAQVVSFVNRMYFYQGGARGDYDYVGWNFDALTGEEIALESLLTDEGREQLNARIGQELDALYPDFAPGEKVAGYDLEKYEFTLEPDGVGFWFEPQEIAPYVAGALFVKLFFEKDADLLRDDYATEDDAWGLELLPGMSQWVASGDSMRYRGVTSDDPDLQDWYDSVSLSFTVDGEETTVEDEYGGFELYAYWLHIPDGDYLLLNNTMENDAQFTALYGMDGEMVGERMSLTGAIGFFDPEPPEDVDDWSEYLYYAPSLTDPNDIPLATRMDLFGTWDGGAVYVLTGDGLECQYELLYNTNTYILTLAQDLLVERLPSDDWTGEPTGEETTLLAGTTVELLAADGENTAFFRSVDGVPDASSDYIFSLSYDAPEERPRTVNGVEEDELFEDIMYAG